MALLAFAGSFAGLFRNDDHLCDATLPICVTTFGHDTPDCKHCECLIIHVLFLQMH